jgi:hypothetical protein
MTHLVTFFRFPTRARFGCNWENSKYQDNDAELMSLAVTAKTLSMLIAIAVRDGFA